MRFVEFHRYLNADNSLRVGFEMEHGRVVKFFVQLQEVNQDYHGYPGL